MAVLLIWAAGAWAQQSGVSTFQNTNAVIIPAAGPAFPIPAAPYPSVIAVSNLSGEITRVTVNLIQFTHSYPDTVDIMLAGPDGQKVLLMSDAGGDNPVSGLILNFADNSTVFLPDSTRIFSGSFRPSNYETGPDVFPAPAPSGALNPSFSVFDGTNPNGLWRLYVVGDSTSPNGGRLDGGWQLSITTTSYPPVILKQPQDQTVSPGDTAQFSVEVSGTPPFVYQWLRNGQVLVPFGQGTDTLRISNVGPPLAGHYSVIIMNPTTQASVQSREASLYVRGPIVVPPPVDQIVPPGIDITLYAAPSGDPPFRFQWRRNGIWLPGETNSTLLLPRVQVTDGGHYSYIVQNRAGARTSEPGLLKVLAATDPRTPADDFLLRPVLLLDHGVLQGTSEKATSERGEPIAIGGGKTMWIEWRPAKTGIVRFTMLGSSFDTILTVFPQDANGGIDTSRIITRDEDRAGFYTSQFDFNAQAGQRYFVQLDGFGIGGDGGEFTLKWDLEPSNLRTPVIVTNPVPQSVKPGDKVTFSAVVEPNPPGLPPLTFQWFFNGLPLSNETGLTLTILNAQSRHVGFYSLRVMNAFGIAVFSPPVGLQLGFPAGYLMQDKLEMLYLSAPGRSQMGNPGGFLMQEKVETLYAMSGSGGGGEYKPIGFGGTAFDQGPWPAQSGAKDPNPCDSPLSGTLWQGLSPTNTGLVQVSTAGSGVGTRMAIYLLTGTPADLLGGNPPLVCDVTSVSNGVPCVATFSATNGSNYTVVVEGYSALTSIVQITSVMGTAPPATCNLKYCLVFLGGSIQLSMPATNWFPAPQCQWYRNGIPITDATNATLDVVNFALSDIGTYSVRMSNFVSTNTCDVAYLDDAPPFELHYSWVSTAGGTGYKITASNAAPFVLETTTDLAGFWTPIATNPDPSLVLYYTNGPPVIGPQRFYRAVQWSSGP